MIDRLMGFISDHLLDDIWAGLYAREYARAAGKVAFNLAFNNQLTSDDQATLASRRRVLSLSKGGCAAWLWRLV